MPNARPIRFSRHRLAAAIGCVCAGVAPLTYAGPNAVATPVTHTVVFCDDPAPHGPLLCGGDDGTLRQALYCAKSGDTVNFAHGCHVITVSAPMTVSASSLTIAGPTDDFIAISGGGTTNPIVHTGTGQLAISNLFITNGYRLNAGDSGGGACISSAGSVKLDSVEVGNCILIPAANTVGHGGAIYAHDQVLLTSSAVKGSSIGSPQSTIPETKGEGGGIWGGSVSLVRSTVSGNKVGKNSSSAFGGGVFAQQQLNMDSSTLGLNFSTGSMGAADCGSLNMINSTVAYNTANSALPGVYAAMSASVIASTIAKNSSPGAGAAGLFTPSANVQINSSILWGNLAAGAPADLHLGGVLTDVSSNNLIGTFSGVSQLPSDTLSENPQLGALQDNGGSTFTMAPSATSPVIDRGNNRVNAYADQRGLPRVVGTAADIGAVELDRVFASSFETLPN